MADLTKWQLARHSMRWLPSYARRRFSGKAHRNRVHLIIALADHFEPAILPERPGASASHAEQLRRLERWCRLYPLMVNEWRDSDGRPFRHTYFYPAEQYDSGLIGRLAEHCHAGWGEVEIHLHHGIDAPDTPQNTTRQLCTFRDLLVEHGCLSRFDKTPLPRYAFVHGNWAVANSANGRFCGVDNELEILAETGCYADVTLPSAPDRTQIAKINAIYECSLPLSQRAAHRRGRDLSVGRAPEILPLIIQGPLLLYWPRRKRRPPLPALEHSEVTISKPPTMERLRRWLSAGITVHGRPDWLFIKLHCHGMDPRDEPVMLGEPMRQFLREVTTSTRNGGGYRVHFVTVREMMNIILAACDGREGNPGEYRDYRLRLIKSAQSAA